MLKVPKYKSDDFRVYGCISYHGYMQLYLTTGLAIHIQYTYIVLNIFFFQSSNLKTGLT